MCQGSELDPIEGVATGPVICCEGDLCNGATKSMSETMELGCEGDLCNNAASITAVNAASITAVSLVLLLLAPVSVVVALFY